MKFEWDPAKHEKNLRTRGIGFDETTLIFEGELLVWPDTRAGYGEPRFNAIGEVNSKILRVTYTLRGDAIRIIAAWKANRKDRRRWQTRS